MCFNQSQKTMLTWCVAMQRTRSVPPKAESSTIRPSQAVLSVPALNKLTRRPSWKDAPQSVATKHRSNHRHSAWRSLNFGENLVQPQRTAPVVITKPRTNTIGLMGIGYRRSRPKECATSTHRRELGHTTTIIAVMLVGTNERNNNT